MMAVQMVASMSEQTNYCTTKGLGWAFLIIILSFTALPLLMSLSIMGPEEYARQCKVAIHMPCFGLN
jgi:hypothetical protein